MPDASDIGEKAVSAAQNLIRKGQEVARRETRVLQLQTQIAKLRSQRQRLFYEMGGKVFSLFERDLVKNQDLRMMCQQIRGLEAEVEMRREEIEQLRRPETRGEGGIDDETVTVPAVYDEEL
jgi:predicted  nucleic acid-binding Zn-ribbon protein